MKDVCWLCVEARGKRRKRGKGKGDGGHTTVNGRDSRHVSARLLGFLGSAVELERVSADYVPR